RSGGCGQTLRRDVSGRAPGHAGESRGMNETQRLENLLAGGNGGSVTLPRRDAVELAQKLKVRGNAGAAARLVERLNSPGDVDLEAEEAKSLLEQLHETGQACRFGSEKARRQSPARDSRPTPY